MYDLTVIGGGPGGYVAAIRAAQLGGKVLLIEEDRLGGTCLNRGCIPTKAMYHVARVVKEVSHGEDIGLRFTNLEVDFRGVASHRDKTVEALVQGVEGLMKANKIDVVTGRGEILAPGKVRVGHREEETKTIIIATGSRQGRPPIPGINSPGVVDTDMILTAREKPQSLLVLGGGVVGVEFAAIMAAFGTEVVLVEMQPGILTAMDSELGRRLAVSLRKSGVKLHTASQVCSIEPREGKLAVEIQGKKEKQQLQVDQVLLAAGRTPNFGGLDLEGLGIEHDRYGIKVDEKMATSVPGIYAVGDCVGGAMLAHVASMEGIVAAENALGQTSTMNYSAVPCCVFTLPEVASVGLTEEQVKAQGLEYKVAKFPFSANGKALGQRDIDGMVKMLAAHDGTILGVHIIGPNASDLIAEATVAVHKKLTAQALAHIIHAHPSLSEAIAEVAHGLTGGYLHYQGR
jgi:dihydrolipoamide dehydrogenase